MRTFTILGLVAIGALTAWGCAKAKETVDSASSVGFGKSEFKQSPNSMAHLPNGKFYVGGTSDFNGSADFSLSRFNIDGSLDSSFGNGGSVSADIDNASDDQLYAVVVQSDGKAVVAGRVGAGTAARMAILRFNVDGSLDSSFGSGGKVIHTVAPGAMSIARSLAVLADGKILVAGFTGANGSNDFAMIRLNSDGSVDGLFGNSGKVITDIGTASTDQAYAVAVQDSGKILLAGVWNSGLAADFAVARYLPDGTLDTSFGTSGITRTDFGKTGIQENDVAFALSILPDGKFLLGGYSNATGDNEFAVARYSADGLLDTTFGTGGRAVAGVSAGSGEWGYAMAVQKDGKIYVVGTTDARGSYHFAAARFRADGTVDTGFGDGGTFVSDIQTNQADSMYVVVADSLDLRLSSSARNEVKSAVFLSRLLGRGF